MRILDDAAVRKLFPMPEAIEVIRDAFRAFSAGRVRQPLRTILHGPNADAFAVMPAYVPLPGEPSRGAFGLKAIAVKPQNPASGLDPHPGLVLLLDPDTAVPAAIVDGTSLTAIRTAAASAVATAALARPNAGILAILGSGTQARAHFEALNVVCNLREVRVWSRTPDHAHAFVKTITLAMRKGSVPTVIQAATVTDAVAGADIICTTTASAEPLLVSDQVGEGAHVNAIGAVFPDRRELASDLVERARIFVDSRESALIEAGDLLLAMREGRLRAEDIAAEIGEVLLAQHPGRSYEHDVTIFESLGLAAQDVLSARYLYDRAMELGIGVTAELCSSGQRMTGVTRCLPTTTT